MSYDIYLNEPDGGVIQFDDDAEIVLIGAGRKAWVNITYNYAPIFRRTISKKDGIRYLYGKTGGDSIAVLEWAIAQLGDNVDQNYWAATEGNAKRALYDLLFLAKLRPDGVWSGD